MIMAAVLIAPAADDIGTVKPPLNMPMRQMTEQVRDDGRMRRSFRIERTLVFAEDADGFRLTVTLASADADASAAERQRYRAANAPLLNRPIVMRLDRAGILRAIDDIDAVWRDWTSGLLAAAPSGRNADADAIRGRLDVLGPAQRQAMVGSIADGLFASPSDRALAPSRPVTMSSPPPFSGMTLAGTTSATAEGDRVRIRTDASGRSTAAATGKDASVAIDSNRLIDPDTGLILSSTRRETFAVPGTKLVTTTTDTLAW